MPKQKGFDDYHAYSASYLNALAQKYHTVFLDYTSHPDFHLSHKFFSDETHLNQNGVENFNAILIDTLLTSGFLSIGMR